MNMTSGIVIVISTLAQVLSLLIIVDSILSFIMPPTHPIRDALGKILNPLYAPIRRIMPVLGGFDLSPLVLLILVQVVTNLIVNLVA
jgi:YggT family protein